MLIYYISIGFSIYIFARILNHFRFNDKPLKKYVAIILSILIFIIMFVIYFIIRLYVHEQVQIQSGIKFEQKKFFSISQSVIDALIFYFTVKKIGKEKIQSEINEKIEPKL